jgi:glycosyltransferase involved in cell wall biosynthesis
MDLLRLRRLQAGIAAQIDSGGYDVVFAHICRFAQSPAVLQFLTTPSVYFCHEPPRFLYETMPARPYRRYSRPQRIGNLIDPLPGLYRSVLRSQDLKSTRSASLVLANSAFSRETIYRVYGIFASTCYLGVDSQLFRPLEVPKGDFVISVGALTSLKGFDFLIRSLALLPATNRPRLALVNNYAEAQEQRYLSKLAADLNVALEFHLNVSPVHGELARLYNQAQLTLYAPIMEPFGLVPLESMACGTPVVGVREAGVRESIMDGQTGLLTERDPEAFATAIEQLLAQPALRARMGEQGIQYVRDRWSWADCHRMIERHLSQTAARSANGTIRQ